MLVTAQLGVAVRWAPCQDDHPQGLHELRQLRSRGGSSSSTSLASMACASMVLPRVVNLRFGGRLFIGPRLHGVIFYIGIGVVTSIVSSIAGCS